MTEHVQIRGRCVEPSGAPGFVFINGVLQQGNVCNSNSVNSKSTCHASRVLYFDVCRESYSFLPLPNKLVCNESLHVTELLVFESGGVKQ